MIPQWSISFASLVSEEAISTVYIIKNHIDTFKLSEVHNAIWIDYIASSEWAGKMNQIPTERARWDYPASSGHPAVSWQKNFHENHIINLLFTKLVRSRWLDIHLILFCEYVDRNGVELGQIYPAILTSQLVNIPYIMIYHKYNVIFFFLEHISLQLRVLEQ